MKSFIDPYSSTLWLCASLLVALVATNGTWLIRKIHAADAADVTDAADSEPGGKPNDGGAPHV